MKALMYNYFVEQLIRCILSTIPIYQNQHRVTGQQKTCSFFVSVAR